MGMMLCLSYMQKPLILDKATGKVTFPAALPGQRLNPGAVQTQMTMTPGAIRRFSLVAIKKNTEVLCTWSEHAECCVSTHACLAFQVEICQPAH